MKRERERERERERGEGARERAMVNPEPLIKLYITLEREIKG